MGYSAILAWMTLLFLARNLTELQHAVHFRAEIAQIRHAGRLIRNPPCDWLEILKCMTKVGDRSAELTNEAVESLNIPAATVLQWCARIGSIQSQKKVGAPSLLLAFLIRDKICVNMRRRRGPF